MKHGNRRTKLVIFATHPIQYQVPWFRALAAVPDLEVQVFYAMLPDASQQGTGFGLEFEWDQPLLDGYSWRMLKNVSAAPSLGRFRGCDVRNLVPTLEQQRPDVALVTGWNSLYLVESLWACKRLRIPVVVRGESNVIKQRSALRRWLLARLIHRFDAYLAIGKGNRAFYLQAGVKEERIFPCRYFIDNEQFAWRADMLRIGRHELRKRWAIPEDVVCFVFVGKLIPKKRIMDFLRAMDQANTRGASVFALVVGTGEQMAEASHFAESRKVPVTFAGFLNQSEIAAAYVAADCLVLPSDYGETWGLVVNEAMACGLPAIVSDQVGCGPDLVTDGQTGAVFPMGNAGMLAEAIIEMAKDRHRLSVLGQAARQRVNTRYSLSQAVDGLMSAAAWVSRCEARRATRD